MRREGDLVVAVTLLDVARAAGVSRTTASNAFNDPTQLSKALRERVLQVAKDLGYAGPSPTARAMRRGRTMVAGVVFEESLQFILDDPYARALLSGLSDRLTSADHALLLLPVDKTSSGVERVQVDGIVTYRVGAGHPVFDVARQRGWRVVQTGATSAAAEDALSVVIDEREGAELAMRHLAELGHRRVFALVDMQESLPPSSAGEPSFPFAEQSLRWCGYSAVAAAYRIELVPVAAGRNLRASGFEAARWLMSNETVTAIAAMTDILGLGAIDAVKAAGLTPGRDISVIGFDDIPEAAEAGLTTVAQPMWERGYQAGRLLLEGRPSREVLLPCSLVERASTGAAPNPSHGPHR